MKLPTPILRIALLQEAGAGLAAQPTLGVTFFAALFVVAVAVIRCSPWWASVRRHATRVLAHPAVPFAISAITVCAFGVMLATQARLHAAYLSDYFATANEIDDQRGFSPTEVNPVGDRCAWTQERATLAVNFLVHRPVTLTFASARFQRGRIQFCATTRMARSAADSCSSSLSLSLPSSVGVPDHARRSIT